MTFPPSSGSGPAPQYAPPPAPPRQRRKGLIIAVIVVVILLVGGSIAVLYFESVAPPVQVSEIDIWAPNNVCGLNTYSIYFPGFNGSTGATQVVDLGMPNFNSTPCTVMAVVTNTSGFTLSEIQVPLVIPGDDNITGVSMNITVTSPSSPFSGPLDLVLS